MCNDKYKYSLRTYKESIRLVGYMDEQCVKRKRSRKKKEMKKIR